MNTLGMIFSFITRLSVLITKSTYESELITSITRLYVIAELISGKLKKTSRASASSVLKKLKAL